MKEKVVLAYSGGLDTTAIIPWLKETYGYEVVCCCINCGQGEELDGLEERAKLSGASKLYIEDITDEFCDDYIVPCVQAGAVYENKYLLGTSMARPVIAKKLVEIAKIQSTEASNAIEGIVTTNTRIRQLVEEKTTPRNKDAQEIAGYRDVLSIIHESFDAIPLTRNYILQLHKHLYTHKNTPLAGRTKLTQK